jgi:hypothetical protein
MRVAKQIEQLEEELKALNAQEPRNEIACRQVERRLGELYKKWHSKPSPLHTTLTELSLPQLMLCQLLQALAPCLAT